MLGTMTPGRCSECVVMACRNHDVSLIQWARLSQAPPSPGHFPFIAQVWPRSGPQLPSGQITGLWTHREPNLDQLLHNAIKIPGISSKWVRRVAMLQLQCGGKSRYGTQSLARRLPWLSNAIKISRSCKKWLMYNCNDGAYRKTRDWKSPLTPGWEHFLAILYPGLYLSPIWLLIV